jgi:hypothetical protein
MYFKVQKYDVSLLGKVHCTFANWRNSRSCIGESPWGGVGESTIDFRQLAKVILAKILLAKFGNPVRIPPTLVENSPSLLVSSAQLREPVGSGCKNLGPDGLYHLSTPTSPTLTPYSALSVFLFFKSFS